MAAYLIYNRTTSKVVGMHTIGSATRPGADLTPSDFFQGIKEINSHGVWKIPSSFFEKIRPEILHELSTYCTINLDGEGLPMGVTVGSSHEIMARHYDETQKSMSGELFQLWTQIKQLEAYLAEYPTEQYAAHGLDLLRQQHETVTNNRNLITQRFTEEGLIDLPPILSEKAGQQING